MRYLTGLPFMVAAGFCIATGMLPGFLVGVALAAMGVDLLRKG